MNLAEFFELNKGSMYCIAFGVMITLQVCLSKILIYSSRASYLTFIRYLFGVFTAIPLVEWEACITYDCTDLFLYVSTAITYVIPCGLSVLSFNYLDVGDSTAIEFGGSLVLVGVIGHFVLDEKLSIPYLILLLVDCVGIVLVVQPSIIFGTLGIHADRKEIGAVLALTGAFCFAVWHVIVRKLAKRNTLKCWLMTFVHGIMGLFIAGVWTAVESAWQVPDTWFRSLLMVGYGLVSTTQFVTGFKALANEDAKKVAVALTLSVVLSYVLQLTAFDAEFDWISIGGAFVVVVCVVLCEFWDYIQKKIDSSLRENYEKLECTSKDGRSN